MPAPWENSMTQLDFELDFWNIYPVKAEYSVYIFGSIALTVLELLIHTANLFYILMHYYFYYGSTSLLLNIYEQMLLVYTLLKHIPTVKHETEKTGAPILKA